MNDYLLGLLRRYQRKGILVDTSLLLLYIVGSIEPAMIRGISRVSSYSEDDFLRISKFISAFDKRITTPHLLTQVTDLLGNRNELNVAISGYIASTVEHFTISADLCKTASFPAFGLADAAVVSEVSGRYLILTDDGPLYGYLVNSGIDAVNLNQIQTIPLN